MSRKECGVIGLCPMLTKGNKVTDCDDCQSIDLGAENGDIAVVGFTSTGVIFVKKEKTIDEILKEVTEAVKRQKKVMKSD